AAPGAAAPANAPAAAPATTATVAGFNKVGIINIQGAIMASNEGRRDLEALDKKFDPKRTELQNLNKEIEDLKKQLSTQGDKMNEDARGTLVRSLETKQKAMQRSSEDAQNEYQQQQAEIAQRILQKMAPLIDKFAKDNQYAVLMDVSQPWPQGPVLWFGANADVTKQVVDLYNAQSGVAAPASTPSSSTKPNSGTTAPKPAAATTHKPATTPPPATPPKPQ
ncbi:MAG TPA: OmpH family outer membrane protein, partial [Terriglobales bacterium]|nr:OmpH family outer membrane protein [Terriglobales bacterium]